VVVHLSALLPRVSGQSWLLSRVRRVILNDDALSQEVQLHLLGSLSIVQADLNSTGSFASAKHIVFVNHRTDHVLTPRNPLQAFSLRIWLQSLDNKIDDLGRGRGGRVAL